MTVATPSSVNDVLEAKLLEAMTMPMPETKARTLARSGLDRILTFMQARTAIAIGPGLSTHPETVELVQSMMKHLDRPSVLDADALNALAGRASLLTECKTPPFSLRTQVKWPDSKSMPLRRASTETASARPDDLPENAACSSS